MEWDTGSRSYVPRRDGACLKFDDTDVFITMIYGGKNDTIRTGRTSVHISSLLKVPPYMQYFFTGYPPIASLEIVEKSSFVITGGEGFSHEPNSYAHFSFRSPSPQKVIRGLLAW